MCCVYRSNLLLMYLFVRNTYRIFTFMLPCNIIDFFLNNQPDALIIHIYSVIKNLHETYQCRMYSRELLMMGREDA